MSPSPSIVAMALCLCLPVAALAENCVSPRFLRQYEEAIADRPLPAMGDGDAEITMGEGQGLREIRFLRPDYALTAFRALDANAEGQLYLGYVEYDPAVLTGEAPGSFADAGSFIAIRQDGVLRLACFGEGKVDASIITSTLEVIAGLDQD